MKKYLIYAVAAVILFFVIRYIIRAMKPGDTITDENGNVVSVPKHKCDLTNIDRTKTISFGSIGNEVCYLQTWLNRWKSANLKVDGIFGKKTLTAVNTHLPNAPFVFTLDNAGGQNAQGNTTGI